MASTTRDKALACRAVIVNVDSDIIDPPSGGVEGKRFMIQFCRSVRVISELCGRLLDCEGNTSVGRTREESVSCADDREESERLVVEWSVEGSVDRGLNLLFLTPEFGGGNGWGPGTVGLRLNANLALGARYFESVASRTPICYNKCRKKCSLDGKGWI